MKLDQSKAPVLEALERMKTQRLVPFDVPGHKRGKGNPDLTAFLGEKCLSVDVNSMKMLDNLCHPVSVPAHQMERLFFFSKFPVLHTPVPASADALLCYFFCYISFLLRCCVIPTPKIERNFL